MDMRSGRENGIDHTPDNFLQTKFTLDDRTRTIRGWRKSRYSHRQSPTKAGLSKKGHDWMLSVQVLEIPRIPGDPSGPSFKLAENREIQKLAALFVRDNSEQKLLPAPDAPSDTAPLIHNLVASCRETNRKGLRDTL
jgi:hypothetical protein